MFVDAVKMKLIAGKGGNGITAWHRLKYIPKGGPAGGNGGPGGCIYIEASDNVYSLDKYVNTSRILGMNGKPGGPNKRQGGSGKDTTLLVPPGTIVRNADTGEIICDLQKHGEKMLLAEGGKGGLGNAFFKTPTNQAPYKNTPGKAGSELSVFLELKIIADVGFVGFPNAGKSSLLSSLASRPIKTGAYPFTTLHPNVSYLEFDDYSRVYIADIPGIIEGASDNKGLGLEFLKHIERTNTLVYVIDIVGSDGRDPLEDFETLRSELKNHDPQLLEKPYLVALNKIDEPGAEENIARFKERYSQHLYPISAFTGENLEGFTNALRETAQRDGKRFY